MNIVRNYMQILCLNWSLGEEEGDFGRFEADFSNFYV